MLQTSTTPVPNVYFDLHLKELNSAELKVLLVIIRQTLGWSDRNALLGRKERDWISSSQLQAKTGSSPRAISSAIEMLVRRNIIEVLDEAGFLLNTPEKRKGKQKLFYRLVDNTEKAGDKPVDKNISNEIFAQDFSKKRMELAQKMRITK